MYFDPNKKYFKGLVRYGQARQAMFNQWKINTSKMFNRGHLTMLEKMEAHASMQRRFKRK